MAIIQETLITPYTTEQMFNLVNQIEDYPKFLPWCHKTTILSRNEDEIRAEIEVVKAGMHKSFSTCNRLYKYKMIELRLINGPFKHLQGFWHFETLNVQSSRVSLDLEFELTGRLLDLAFGPIFHQLSHRFVHAFLERAKEVYG